MWREIEREKQSEKDIFRGSNEKGKMTQIIARKGLRENTRATYTFNTKKKRLKKLIY